MEQRRRCEASADDLARLMSKYCQHRKGFKYSEEKKVLDAKLHTGLVKRNHDLLDLKNQGVEKIDLEIEAYYEVVLN